MLIADLGLTSRVVSVINLKGIETVDELVKVSALSLTEPLPRPDSWVMPLCLEELEQLRDCLAKVGRTICL